MTLPEALEAAVDAALGEEPSFSGVVLVRRGGSTLLERAQGFAQRAEEIPNRPDTRFGTASCSKIFTATAVLQLVETGALELTASVSERLAIPYPIDAAITAEHLLTHTSGLPDYFDEEEMSDEDCLARMRRYPGHTLTSPSDYLVMFPDRPCFLELDLQVTILDNVGEGAARVWRRVRESIDSHRQPLDASASSAKAGTP